MTDPRELPPPDYPGPPPDPEMEAIAEQMRTDYEAARQEAIAEGAGVAPDGSTVLYSGNATGEV